MGSTKGQPGRVTTVEEESVSFDSIGFSVYAIIGTDGYSENDVTRNIYHFYVGENNNVSNQIIKDGDMLIEPDVPYTNSNQYFEGWYIEGTDTKISFDTPISVLPDEEDSEIYVVAVFTEKHIVTFYEKEQDGVQAIVETIVGKTGDTISTANITPQTLSGNDELIGWSVDKNATEPTYGIDALITIENSNIDLYPVTRSVRQIEFFGNGGEDYVTFTSPITVIPGDTANEPQEPTRAGYTFSGWYLDQDCTTSFDWSSPVESGSESIKLYAKWIPKIVSYEIYVWGEKYNDEGTEIEGYVVKMHWNQEIYAGQQFFTQTPD